MLFRQLTTAILFTAAMMAQEPGDTTFRTTTTTVLVPFNVQRGKYFAADLQASDFTLLEDGHPRQFTVFEGPNTRHPLPLELILVFDTSKSKPKNGIGAMELVWNAKANYEFLNHWDEATTQTVLRQSGMDVRLSIYHFDDGHFERLCRASGDPQEIGEAFRKLLNPIPAANQLTLLAGDRVIPRGTMMNLSSPGWWQEAAVEAMRDASDSQPAARRIMLVFSDFGPGGTVGHHWQAIGNEAIAGGVEIDPVVLDFYKLAPHINGASDRSSQIRHHDTPPAAAQWAEMTGGEVHSPEHLNQDEMAIILQRMRNRTLSKYLVGFTPDAAAKPGKHNLQVELKPKIAGKIIDGERDDVVY